MYGDVGRQLLLDFCLFQEFSSLNDFKISQTEESFLANVTSVRGNLFSCVCQTVAELAAVSEGHQRSTRRLVEAVFLKRLLILTPTTQPLCSSTSLHHPMREERKKLALHYPSQTGEWDRPVPRGAERSALREEHR